MKNVYLKDFECFTLLENESDFILYACNGRDKPESYPCYAHAKLINGGFHPDYWDVKFIYKDELVEMYKTLMEIDEN